MARRTAESESDPNPPASGQSPVTALTDRFDLTTHRRYLARDLDGVVLDLGAGDGTLFPYLQQARNRESSLRLYAIEPDPHRLRQAKRTAREYDLDIQLQSGRAESLPYADDTFDVVIASAVFCTVQGPSRALTEVHRVLKPDGQFRFLEHVRADGLWGAVQDAVTPLWKRIDNGCHVNRRTDDLIATGPFEIDEIETVNLGIMPSRPFIRGIARPVSRIES